MVGGDEDVGRSNPYDTIESNENSKDSSSYTSNSRDIDNNIINNNIRYNNDNNDQYDVLRDDGNGEKRSQSMTTRDIFGTLLSGASDLVNDNLVIVRSGGIAGIGLLALYGLLQTPLFFRYKTVHEIPSVHFQRRKNIHCRIVKIQPPSQQTTHNHQNLYSHHSHHKQHVQEIQQQQPIMIYVRHLSPFERLIPKSNFEFIMKLHQLPWQSSLSSQLSTSTESNRDILDDVVEQGLLPIQLAHIVSPTLPSTIDSFEWNSSPGSLSLADESMQFLKKLADDRVVVKCQLQARIVSPKQQPQSQSSSLSSSKYSAILMKEIEGTPSLTKRPIPNLASPHGLLSGNTNDNWSNERLWNQRALAIVYYRDNIGMFRSLFSYTDLGCALVRRGLASISTELNHGGPPEHVVDAGQSVPDLRRNAKYLQKLDLTEYEACKGLHGIWSDPQYRASRQDIVDEVEFQEKASIVRKIWRWLRGG